MKKWIIGVLVIVAIVAFTSNGYRKAQIEEGINNTQEIIETLETHLITKSYLNKDLELFIKLYKDMNEKHYVDLPDYIVNQITELNSISERLVKSDIEGIEYFYIRDEIEKNTIISERDKGYLIKFVDHQLNKKFAMEENDINDMINLYLDGEDEEIREILKVKQRYKERLDEKQAKKDAQKKAREKAEENAKKAAEERIKDKLIISNINYDGDKVSFSVKNNKSSTITYIEFDIRVMDSSNNVIDTDWTNWSGNLRVGDSAKVETYVSDGKSISVNVSDWSY